MAASQLAPAQRGNANSVPAPSTNDPASPTFPHAGDRVVLVHQLRDPAIYEEAGRVYLLSST
jgi:hypothetical protein